MKKMRTALLVILSVFCFMGCMKYPTHEVSYKKAIPAEKKDAAAVWILDAVKAANPLSDEEPEDNIIQAERTALGLFGVMTIGLDVDLSAAKYTVFVPYDECTEWQKDIVDAYINEGGHAER